MTAPAPDTPTRIYLGCSAAFLSVFLLVGLVALAAALTGDTENPLAIVGIGVAFVAVPAGGLLLVRWAWGQAGRREQRKRMAPDQPWTWKRRVSPSGVVMGQSPIATVAFLTVFAGLWLAMIGTVTYFAWERVRAEPALGAVLALFWVAGLFLAFLAGHSILHARRFGRSSLRLDQTPAHLGQWVSGVVSAPHDVRGAEAQLEVSCVETTRSYGRNSSSTWVRWRTTKVLDGARFELSGDRAGIPFAVRLPTNEEVDEGAVDLVGTRMDWYVAVSARLPGVDYSDRFAIPVAPAQAGVVADAAPPREMYELAGDQLAARLPGRFERAPDGDVFAFPVKTGWIVWILLFAGVAALPLYAADLAFLAALPPPAVRWAAIGGGVLLAMSLVGLMMDTRRIEVSPEAVRIRRGVLGIGFHRTLMRSDVAAVEEEASRSDPPTYSVNIRTRDGQSFLAAMALSEPDQAAALAHRLRSILQLDPEP